MILPENETWKDKFGERSRQDHGESSKGSGNTERILYGNLRKLFWV